MKGFGKIFDFTLRQQTRTKGYRAATISLALLAFLLPVVIMGLVEWFGDDETEAVSAVQTVYVADVTGDQEISYDVLNQMGNENFSHISYEDCKGDLELALEKGAADSASLVLLVEYKEDSYKITVLLPDETELSGADADDFERFLNTNFQGIILQKSGLSVVQMLQMTMTTSVFVEGVDDAGELGETDEEEEALDVVKELLSMILPFGNIMLLYFLVLFYGQSVANSVIMEKNSKLMDTFLISVKPSTMVFGKVFAVVLASVIQFVIWAAALVGGFAVGVYAVKMINPNTQMGIIQFFDALGIFGGMLEGMFTLPGLVLFIIMTASGFLLYCSLAAIGGAIASKPEDLSSTNVMFTMALVISFFCTLYAGGLAEMEGNFAPWLDWVPFTAILVTPSRILLGEVSLLKGLASLAIVFLTSGVVLWGAGKVYKMMSLYKGNPPTPAKLIRMIKQK